MRSRFQPSISEREAVRELLGRLKAQRLSRNWSQAEVAARAGLTRTAYQNFELGLSNATLLSVVRILGVLGFLDRLAELIPVAEAPRTLETLNEPKRQRAWRRKKDAT
ncbi:helix-turn-helix domain-containing protein [Nibricoccus sp. IMCC34717]|uniref:helix-turn-helix domain-containing protein n=1 Tax=Nibricoccus sp. IMCC34717 TaxID=3034021 RepID=UPI00384E8655